MGRLNERYLNGLELVLKTGTCGFESHFRSSAFAHSLHCYLFTLGLRKFTHDELREDVEFNPT